MIDMKPIVLQSDCLSLLRLIPTDHKSALRNDTGIGNIGNIESIPITPLSNQLWVECLRVCKGLVAWVVEGQTKQFKYSATPILLMVELHKAGVTLRKPPIYHRVGIPGSGGPDWLRNDYEFIICATKQTVKRLPWSDNTAMGKPPKYAPGGDLSHRTHTDERVSNKRAYKPPTKANPGNVGGGQMGSSLAHQNEAPFPESLAVAMRNDRQSVGIDIRASQIKLSKERCGIE